MLLRALVWQHRSCYFTGSIVASRLSYTPGMPSRGGTNREIEIKLRVTDASALLGKLRRLRAASRGRVFERNTLYDTPDSALRRAGCILRLRSESPAPPARSRASGKGTPFPGGHPRAILAMKAPVLAPSQRYKERLECERVITKGHAWPAILRSLGFHAVFRYEKYRTALRLLGLEVDLDETPIGIFLELEGAPSKIDRVARMLGYAPRDYICATYGELYAAHCRRRGRFPRDMVFAA